MEDEIKEYASQAGIKQIFMTSVKDNKNIVEPLHTLIKDVVTRRSPILRKPRTDTVVIEHSDSIKYKKGKQEPSLFKRLFGCMP